MPRLRVKWRFTEKNLILWLHEQLRQWNIQGGSPYTRQPYERRLLVLTSASQLQYLSDTPLSDTDEVLVVNVVDSVFEQAPRYDWLGPRLHSLCIVFCMINFCKLKYINEMKKKRNYPTPLLRVVELRVDTHLLVASTDRGFKATISGYQADEEGDGFSQD